MTKRKNAMHQRDAIKLYQGFLAEEKGKPDTRGERGRSRGSRRRAIDRLTERCGYSDWHSAYAIVARWEKKNRPLDFETWGMELDGEFAAEIRRIQGIADLGIQGARAVHDAMTALKMAEPELATSLIISLKEERPCTLCPYCKAVLDGCAHCNGECWFDEVPDCDPRLLDREVQWVDLDGEIKLMDEIV